MTRFALAAAVALAPLAAASQTFVRDAAPFAVTASGEDIPFPFVGGFFEPRPSLVDIDADGDADLVVNVGGAGLQLFERDGADWVWRTDRIGGITPGNWATFGDLDGDGDLDLLARGEPGRVRYWENVGTPEVPVYEVGADLLRDSAGEPVNVEDSSIPALADIDGDGDVDLFAGKADIGTITYYRHDGLDEAGRPLFTFASDEYQDIVIYEENPQCQAGRPVDVPGGAGGGPNLPGGAGTQRGSMHGANAIAVADLVDADGAPELFWGDFFAPSLFFFRNTGSGTEAVLELESDRFPVGQPLTSGGYNAPTYGDWDGDQDYDLIVGVQRGLCFQSRTAVSNLIAFENAGTPAEPDLRIVTDRLIESVDLGSRSAAAIADLDADGDPDLILANESNPDDPSRANLVLYENIGTATAPAFELADADWLSLAYDFGAYAPIAGDLDADGDLDLLVGGFNGRLALLQNNGTPAEPSFVRVDDRFGDIDTGQYLRGSLGDIDADGDLDLIGGASNGRIRLYRNIGTPQTPQFETQGRGTPSEADEAFRESIGLPEEVGGDSAPSFGDLDGDGDLDIVIGTATGELRVFRNVGTHEAPRFEAEEPILSGRRRTTPTIGDLDSDGQPEILAGTSAGGFLFWRSVGETGMLPSPDGEDVALRVTPNPSTGAVTFETSAPAGDVVVFDARGRQLATVAVERGTAEWDGHEATAPGVYLAQLRASGAAATVPFTRLR